MLHQYKQSFLDKLTGTMRVPEQDEIYNSVPSDEEREEYQRTIGDDPEEDDGGAGELAIDMYETENEIVIQSMIAGVTPENLNITITRDSVSIEGRRVEPAGIHEDQYIEKQLYWGAFEKSIDLPYEIDTEGAEAVEKYGLLIIRLPKLNISRSAKLKVKSI